MTKKLYNVTVEFEYAVLAEDEYEAAHYAEEAFGDCDASACCLVSEATPDPTGEVTRPSGWTDDTLVYGARNEDVTLVQAIEKHVLKKESA
jgi:hypothetical protein